MTENNQKRVDVRDERSSAAEVIRKLRASEYLVPDFYTSDRDLKGYTEILGDLNPFFEYVQGLRSGQAILDIGAGSTRATAELSEVSQSKGFRFEATVLSRAPITAFFPRKPKNYTVHITSAEVLRGISKESFGGVLAVDSVGYSNSPKLAVNSIDNILVPGGVFIGSFVSESFKFNATPFGFRKHQPTTNEFAQKKYDIATGTINGPAVLCAIKPGGNNIINAEDLLSSMLRYSSAH